MADNIDSYLRINTFNHGVLITWQNVIMFYNINATFLSTDLETIETIIKLGNTLSSSFVGKSNSTLIY